MFLEERLDSLDRKISAIEEKVDLIYDKISSMQTFSPQPTDESQLKMDFEKFKQNWNSDSPELEGLKGTLSKLRESLFALNDSLTTQQIEP